MGGDHAPAVVIEGAIAAARHLPVHLVLAGQRPAIEAELARLSSGHLSVSIVEAADVIGMAEPPAASLRRKPAASLAASARLAADGA